MGKKKTVFEVDGLLKNSYLDKHGSKNVTFEFNASEAVEVAKLELMGRDLVEHLPVLLRIKVEISPNYGKDGALQKLDEAPRQKRSIRQRTANP